MVKFYVEGRNGFESGTADTPEKAAEILRLLFVGKRAYVVNDDKTVHSCLNMTMDEANTLNPFKAVVTAKPPMTVKEFVGQPSEVSSFVLVNAHHRLHATPLVKTKKKVKLKPKLVKKLLKKTKKKVKPLKVKAIAAEKEVVKGKPKKAAKIAAKKSAKKAKKKGKK
jgi:hypothetical protein